MVLLTGMAFVSVPCGMLLAQEGGSSATISPVNDLIERATSALNNLKYDEAISLAREALAQRRIRTPQALILNQLIAAAFFPDPADGGRDQRPDSAVTYLRRAIKLQADAPLSDVYRWAGMDSLFAQTKAQTFASSVRPSAENALTGMDGRAFVEVVSTRPAVMYLRSRSERDGAMVTHDSSSATTRARLALRAHDGVNPLFVTGDYEIRVEVRDLQTGQADTIGFPATANGAPPAIDHIPELSPLALKPERAPRARGKGIAAGLVMGTATVLLSLYARAEEPIRSTYSSDGRARFVAFAISAGAITGGFLDRGMPLPDNVAANVITRAEHAKAVAVVQDGNRKRVADYRVLLRINVEGGR